MSIATERPTPAYQISSVDRALTLLTLIGERSQVFVSEAAAYLGTSPSTAHRILQMLVLHGYVVQGEHRAYRRGPAMLNLSEHTPAPRDFAALVRPHVSRLRDDLHGTVHMIVLEGNGARFVAGAQCTPTPNLARLRLGWLLPAHVVAGGKALLAELSNDSLALLYPGGVPLTRHGRIYSLAQLRRELAEVRRRGYARSVGEATEDVTAIAIALPATGGMLRTAISVGWDTPDMLIAEEEEVVGAVRHAIAAVSADLRALQEARVS